MKTKPIYSFLLLLALMLLSGCCPLRMVNIHPDWNPVNGQKEAEDRCSAQSRAYTTGAYDIIDAAFFVHEKLYNSCMASYGYERRNVCPEKK